MWHRSGLLNTTTLSMQATTDGVLAAINRKNIPMEQYRQLQHRYTRAGIRTYTEVILGLPTETRDSFKRGLDYVLDMGNHDDVRIYELSILPNAPMANPQVRDAYGIQVIDKHLLPQMPGMPATPADEIETIPTVIATASMSRADWVDCSVYARQLQFLHAQCLTRYLAIHLSRSTESTTATSTGPSRSTSGRGRIAPWVPSLPCSTTFTSGSSDPQRSAGPTLRRPSDRRGGPVPAAPALGVADRLGMAQPRPEPRRLLR